LYPAFVILFSFRCVAHLYCNKYFGKKNKTLKLYFIILLVICSKTLLAQDINNIIKEGNDAYKTNDFKTSTELYKKALAKDAQNKVAKFNLGNALEKQKNAEEAEKYYNEVATSTTDADLKSKALYNKGVAQVQQQKLEEAIEAFKQSLTLKPDDNDIRENLQKAINDLKKKQQSSSQNQKKQKPQPEKKNKQPNKEMMEQKFNELRDNEKQLQKALQRKPNLEQPQKDW